MNNWFTVKVKYTKQLENGSFKRVSEPYLLAAMTFTDAEARIYEELGTTIKGEFNVVGITRTELHDVFYYDDADTWYKVKLTYETTDMDAEKTKKVSQNFLITANSVKEAYERIKESLSTLMVDFMIPAITQSPIVDVFPYAEELDREIARRPLEEGEEFPSTPGAKVYSAPGSEEDEEEEDLSENEMSDEYAED